MGCETDESITEKEVILNQYPQIETVSYQEFTKNFDDINNKMDLYKSIEGKSLKSSEGDFIIKTDDIKRIKQGEYISYTMVLEKRNPKNSTIYNLTIENKAGIPGMFITAYKPSPQWLADKTKTFDGEINTYRTDVITHIPENEEPPESGDGGTSGGGGGQGDGTAYPYDCEGEVVSSRVAVPYSCGCGHLPGQGCQGCDRESPYLPGYEYIDVYECYNSSTGENGGSTDQPSGGSGDDSTNNTSNDLHSLTILMDDGSRVTTAEYLTNMWSLNYSESQKLKEKTTFSDRLYFYMQNNQFSRQAMVFGNEAFDAFMNDGQVDFEARLINNPGLHDFLKGKMSPSELELFQNLSLMQKALYLRAASEAYTYAEIFYPKPVRNRKGDAIKHTLWNALSTNYIGSSITKQLTDAHEDINYDPDYPNHFKETQMDLFNNAKGRGLATQYGGFIFQLVEDALDNGELMYLNHLVFLNGFYNATNDSQLTPTNQ